jgi:hypothetical protein
MPQPLFWLLRRAEGYGEVTSGQWLMRKKYRFHPFEGLLVVRGRRGHGSSKLACLETGNHPA